MEKAQDEHKFTSRTGMLERSVSLDLEENRAVIFLDRSVAPYANWVHAGTRPHVISASRKKVLRWTNGSSFAFAKRVHHPGTKPDEFLYRAAENSREQINAIFNRNIDRALGGL